MEAPNDSIEKRRAQGILDGIVRMAGRSNEHRYMELTHKDVDTIARDLRLGLLERFILWLSKTDVYALSVCTYHTRLTLNSLGFMVMFTSMLAFVSGYITLSIIMPEIELRGVVAFFGATLYSFGILLIDREIVGSPSHRAMWIRLLFTLLIATAVSYPIKLKLLDGPITAEINKMVEERNAKEVERINKIKSDGKKNIEDQNTFLKNQIKTEEENVKQAQANAKAEAEKESLGKACGIRCIAENNRADAAQKRIKTFRDEMEKLTSADGLTNAEREEIGRLQNEIDKQKHNANDFLSFWQAQDRVMKKDQSGARVLSFFLFAFFLALELVPVGLKYSLGTTEYQQYLEARLRLNLQKIATVTNLVLTSLQQATSLEEILKMPPEFSDILAYLMEDGAVPSYLEPALKALLAERAHTNPGNVQAASSQGGSAAPQA